MGALTIRNLPEETHRALKARARRHGRSTEAEVREILGEAVRPTKGVESTMHEIGMAVGGAELDLRRSTDAPQRADLG